MFDRMKQTESKAMQTKRIEAETKPKTQIVAKQMPKRPFKAASAVADKKTDADSADAVDANVANCRYSCCSKTDDGAESNSEWD